MTFVTLALRRVLLAIPMLFGIATATFLLTRIVPGDPVAELAGQFASEETLQQLRAEYGFDKPMLEQYWTFLGDALRFDLGNSVITGRSVAEDLGQTLPSTIELVVLTLVVASLLGVTAGIVSALRRGRRSDSAIRATSFALLAVPEFWFALVALYLFFFQLGIAPAPVGQIGLTDARPEHITGAMLVDSALTLNGPAFVASLHHAMLPVLTFGLVLSAPITRLMRSSMLEILDADYIRFGRSLGLPSKVLWRYAARAALPPVVTYGAILFTTLIGGAVLVETIFSWGGAAQYAAEAVRSNDYNAVQGFVLVVGFISVAVFFLVDLAYMVIDPRVRMEGGGGALRALVRAPSAIAGGLRRLARNATPTPAGATTSQATVATTGAHGVIDLDGAPARRGVGDALRTAAQWPARTVVRLRDARRDRRAHGVRNRSLTAGITIIVVLIVGAFLVPALWPDSPTTADPSATLESPSLRHPFGTDASGFDIFVRVFAAARTDLSLAALGVILGAVIGIGLGIAAGFSRGWFGELVMRLTDVLQAFPMFILALVLVALTGNDLRNVVFALAFVNAPIFLRLVRSRVLTVRELRFIEASVALGNSRARLVLRHVLPNAIGPAVVQFGLSLGYGILSVAGLAFLGVGVGPPTPEWGSMILTGRSNILTGQWWTVVFPGIAIAIAVAGFNLLSEGIEQARAINQPGGRRRRATPAEIRDEMETKEAAVV